MLMKRTFIWVLAALMLGTSAYAQSPTKEKAATTTATSKETATKQAVRMADNLKLDDQTQEWFVPLYAEYREALRAVRNTACPLSADGKKRNLQELNDKEATQYIENGFAQTEKEVALKKSYYAKFKKKLTPQQLLAIFSRGGHPGNGKVRHLKPMHGHNHPNGMKFQRQQARKVQP